MKILVQLGQWFQPAIWLLNRLKYPQKFALISCVLLLPLGLMLFLLISDLQDNVQFTRLEMEGLEYLAALRQFQEAVLHFQLQPDPLTASIRSEQEAHLNLRWRSLQAADQKGRDSLHTQAKFAPLQQTWQTWKAHSYRRSEQDLGLLQTQMDELWNHIGNSSNLVQDPHLNSYYIMDALFFKLPIIQADLATIPQIFQANSPARPSSLTHKEFIQLLRIGGNLSQTYQDFIDHLNVAFHQNFIEESQGNLSPNLQTNHLQTNLIHFSQLLQPLLNVLQDLKPLDDTVDIPWLKRQSTISLRQSFILWDDLNQQLTALLQGRIQQLIYRQWSLGLFVLLFLLIAIYLFVGFYLSVMQTVASLRAASRRMIAGTQKNAITLSSHDEMAEVVTSFNQVADALRSAEKKYRSIVENAVEGIYQTTLEGTYLTVNPMLAKLYGYDSPEELITHLTDLNQQLYVNSDRRQQFTDLMAEQGVVIGFESEVYQRDGSTIWISESARAIYDSEGQLLGFEGTVVDITRRKQDEEEILRLTEQLQGENLRMGAELEITRRLQQMLIPSEAELNAIADLEIAGFMEPATEVGGDYYDIWQQDGKLLISMGDVTGHGLESSMVMIMAQTAVRTLIVNGETDPARLLNVVNQIIYENARRMGSYKNMTLVLLEYKAGLLRLSGQHEELILVRQNGQIEQIDTLELGFPLGLESDIFHLVSETEINLYPGDVAVLYTDGITEAMNPQNQQYGLERLCEVLQIYRHSPAQKIRHMIIEDLMRHIHTQKVFDDITLLVLKQQ